ncbi:MAG: CsgG/HfaB family protein [bacterium]
MTGSTKNRIMVSIMLLLIIFCNLSVIAEEPLIAVLPVEEGDFSWKGFGGDEILNGITQLITDRIVQVDGIRVVERTRVVDILNEQDFANSGRVDPETAAQIGRILGVDSIILATLTQMEVGEKGGLSFGPVSLSGVTAKIVITGRVVDATTAEVKASYISQGTASEASLSVSDIKGLSFGTNAFWGSVLGKSIEKAVEDFTENIAAEPDNLRTSITQLEGEIVAILGEKIIINIGANDKVKERQLGNLVRMIVAEGLVEPAAVPIGEVQVVSVNDSSAIVEILESDDQPQIGDYVYLETMR